MFFLTVLRYIHQNPLKSGICKKVSNYEYSSYKEYIENSNITDIEFCLEMMGLEQFIDFNNETNSDICLDAEESVFRLTDEEAKEIIQRISHCENATEFQNLDINKRDKFIKRLKEKGLSIRQICRLTGVSFSVVRKI